MDVLRLARSLSTQLYGVGAWDSRRDMSSKTSPSRRASSRAQSPKSRIAFYEFEVRSHLDERPTRTLAIVDAIWKSAIPAKMPNPCHLRRHMPCTRSARPNSAPSSEIPAVPADPITSLRPLFLLSLQQTLPALHRLHPRPCYPVTEVHKWQQQPKLPQRQQQLIPIPSCAG